MAINKEALERFKMKQTAEAGNLKNHIGEDLTIERWEESEYVDVNGEYHKVLALKIFGTTDIYRTEVTAFIEKFKAYAEVFGEYPVEERPRIRIVGKQSKRNNTYISFEILDESGNIL